jgi:hypothetical protein
LQRAKRGIRQEDRCGLLAAEYIEDTESEAGLLGRATRMPVGGTGGGAETRCDRSFKTAVMGKTVTPLIPKAGAAEGKLSVRLDALVALVSDFGAPVLRGFSGNLRVTELLDQDVQVVNISEEVLETLEVFAPRSVVFGQEAFDGIAEFFEPDAEHVPRLGFFSAQSLAMEFAGFFKTLESKALGGKAGRGDKTDTPV